MLCLAGIAFPVYMVSSRRVKNSRLVQEQLRESTPGEMRFVVIICIAAVVLTIAMILFR